MELKVYNINGNDTGRTIVVDDTLFGTEPNDHCIWLAVKQYLADQRQGTHKSKERSEVSGSTRKLKRQKGTGGARAGDTNSPTIKGGGRVFGPRPRDYRFKLNKKVKQFSDLLENVPFDKDEVLSLIAPQHQTILDASDNVYATGYKRTRAGKQFLELRFDGIAGCLRTPSGGSSRQYVIVKKDGQTHARLLTAREVVRLMGAPDSYQIPFSYNETYKAMGDAVALPVVKHLSEHLLRPLAEIAYH